MELDLELYLSGDDLSAQEVTEVLLKVTGVNSLDFSISSLANRGDCIDVAFRSLDSNNMNSDSLFLSIDSQLSVEKLALFLGVLLGSSVMLNRSKTHI